MHALSVAAGSPYRKILHKWRAEALPIAKSCTKEPQRLTWQVIGPRYTKDIRNKPKTSLLTWAAIAALLVGAAVTTLPCLAPRFLRMRATIMNGRFVRFLKSDDSINRITLKFAQ